MADLITIDGSFGEGGGQILRTSLALSLIMQKPVHIVNIRAGRSKPGLRPQHITSVAAAAEVSGAEVAGNIIGSSEITFIPKAVSTGDYSFSTGTAGSCTLVLQTVLMPLIAAGEPSRLHLEGGTHNPFAPPFDFLEKTFLPVLCRMGPAVTARLFRPGFFPAGGGRMDVEIERAVGPEPIELTDRGKILGITARAIVAHLPRHIGARELAVISDTLPISPHESTVEEISKSRGPGNAVIIEIQCEHITELFTAFGKRGLPAEDVAMDVVEQARAYLDSSAPVGPHLADQLLLPMALAGSGAFRTVAPTPHFTTNCEIIKRFMPVEFSLAQVSRTDWQVVVSRVT